jgi:hypothetical protein
MENALELEAPEPSESQDEAKPSGRDDCLFVFPSLLTDIVGSRNGVYRTRFYPRYDTLDSVV